MAASCTYSNCNYLHIDRAALTPRFSIVDNESLNDGIAYLNNHGYAVFSDVLSQDEISTNIDSLWQFFENIPGCRIQRRDPSTWSNYWGANWEDKVGPPGLIGHYLAPILQMREV
ncbi:unnamed protein product [Rotaria magnacalcarata]|uniref:Uncharacterized protein n=1 Tax=Rotaria magnacalcarata TaxID=392030 RepID=A0A818ZCG0_9BILA|nr:unnamed protein product [Rotaria magnacalcarata]CAF4715155.1 unnamed protein product [Rotaria magnacalcarata]